MQLSKKLNNKHKKTEALIVSGEGKSIFKKEFPLIIFGTINGSVFGLIAGALIVSTVSIFIIKFYESIFMGSFLREYVIINFESIFFNGLFSGFILGSLNGGLSKSKKLAAYSFIYIGFLFSQIIRIVLTNKYSRNKSVLTGRA